MLLPSLRCVACFAVLCPTVSWLVVLLVAAHAGASLSIAYIMYIKQHDLPKAKRTLGLLTHFLDCQQIC